MQTLAPAFASNSVTAPPIPREPPVMTARRPFRLNGSEIGAMRLVSDFVVDHFADRVLNVQLDFLRAIGAIGGNDDAVVDHRGERSPALRAERERGDALFLCGIRGLNEVRGVSARGVQNQQI